MSRSAVRVRSLAHTQALGLGFANYAASSRTAVYSADLRPLRCLAVLKHGSAESAHWLQFWSLAGRWPGLLHNERPRRTAVYFADLRPLRCLAVLKHGSAESAHWLQFWFFGRPLAGLFA